MEYTLTMTFLTEIGEKANISISEVRNDITENEAFSLMDTIIANNIFTSKKGDLTSKYNAYLTQRQVTKFDL